MFLRLFRREKKDGRVIPHTARTNLKHADIDGYTRSEWIAIFFEICCLYRRSAASCNATHFCELITRLAFPCSPSQVPSNYKMYSKFCDNSWDGASHNVDVTVLMQVCENACNPCVCACCPSSQHFQPWELLRLFKFIIIINSTSSLAGKGQGWDHV